MKRIITSAFIAAACVFGSYAQGTITLTTSAPAGTKIRILPNVKSTTTPLSIDFGNGIVTKHTVNPSSPAYQRWIEGTVEGDKIIISGEVTELNINDAQLTTAKVEGMSNLSKLELQKNALTDFTISGTTPLTILDLSQNHLRNNTAENPTLSLENAGETLTSLNISENDNLICLDMRHLKALQYFTATDCPQLGSVFICAPEESHDNLRSINLSNCSLAHFYPISMPQLSSLNLSNNALMTTDDDVDPFMMGDYPKLTSLNLSGNPQVEKADVTGCPELESIDIKGCGFKSLDLSYCPELISLNAAGNKIPVLNLDNNKKLSTIDLTGNPISELNPRLFPQLRRLYISDTRISRLDLLEAYYLTEIKASNTLLEFVDFNGVQPSNLSLVDLRDNKRMTGESVDYTIHTLPVAKQSYNPAENLLLSGSNGETADISYATSTDMQWKCDITGSGTSSHTKVPVTLEGATDTGSNVTGVLDRLYPFFGLKLEYDLDRYSTDGGEFLLAQWQPVYFQTIASVTDQAYPGVPMHVYAYPAEGKRFRSVTVNGEEIFSPWFMVSGPATVKVNFVNEESSVKFNTTVGQELSFLVNTIDNNGTIYVDWGNGSRIPVTGVNGYISGSEELKGARIDGKAAGETITIYGDLAGIDLSGFGDAAEMFGLWDNAVDAIDLTNAPDLKYLALYWNPVKTIDLSHNGNLELLDVSYTAIKDLDLSHTPNLFCLKAYSDGFGDEEEGIAQLTSINVTNLPYLQYLDVKGNLLTDIDLTQNEMLTWAFLNDNLIESIDLSKNNDLEQLNIGKNKLTAIDLSNNPFLTTLNVENNKLTSVDLSHNTQLKELIVSNNDIHTLDTSMLTGLRQLYINGNGMTAGELNDLYYILPQRTPDTPDEGNPGVGQVSYNLAVIQGGDTKENDGNRADSTIAEDRGWTPSHTGTNGGCDVVYLDMYTHPNGTYTVSDAAGNIYTHGSKVPKYEPLTITATPAEGYTMAHFSLNDEAPREGNTFEMPGVYTKLHVVFKNTGGIDNVNGNGTGASIAAGRGQLAISATESATIDIYSTDGRQVANLRVKGSETIALPAGLYLVRVATAYGTSTSTVAVR